MTLAISRRKALGLVAAGAVSACPICAAVASELAHGAADGAKAAAGHAPHWSYDGEGAPGKWGQLQADFRACDLGMEQSPIDLRNAVRAEVGAVEPSFRDMPLVVLNNGHTIQVNCAAGSQTLINGTRYDLLQFHFHHPSEHLLSGKAFDMELHFVHRNEAGRLAVLGVFIQPGATNYALEPIWTAMPSEAGPAREAGTTIRPAALLPTARGYFRYAGSLTTPPCSEGVLWTVFKDPIEASPDQVRRFAALFPVNARPAQSAARRYLLETR
ncbi:MAG: carbonic anhydrase [Candidatus Eiseniibacteriota bacterium]